MLDENGIFRPHSLKQQQAILSKKKILLLGCGTQFGKTVVGGIRMKMKIHQFTDPKDNFIITSPTYKTLMQSTLPVFLRLMEGMGELNKKDDVFKIYGGGTVYLRTEHDPDSIVGITNTRHIWGDEAGKYRLYFWENMQARAEFYGCGIDLTTSPYTINWIYKELIKPWKMGLRPDVDLIQAASWENKYHSLHDPEKLAFKKATMDPRRFNMIYGGQWDKMEGLVYDCFDETENVCEPFILPENTRYVAGVDWGYNPDPFVIKVHTLLPDGRRYAVSEFCKTGQTPTDMVNIAKQKKQIFGITHFYCDPSQPGMIEEFCRNGIPALPADNDIVRGIGAVYEGYKTRTFKIFKGTCPYTIDEIETYHYPDIQDLKPDQNQKEPKPVDQNNHCNDADRYCVIMTHRSHNKLNPKEPEIKKQETQLQRIERLKRLKTNRHTESFG